MAMKGEVKDPSTGTGQNRPHAPAGCTCGKPQACTCGGTPATVTINQVYVGGSPAAACTPTGHDRPPADPQPPKPETRPMTGPEQIDALSRAIRAFHDHWARGPERIAELRAARTALLRRPPAGVPKTASAHH